MPPVLSAIDVSKSFGAVRALDRARLVVERGEIHALLGANGCGKSTLCKIVAGTVARDAGDIRIDGEARELGSPRAAEAEGVALFYQELSLVPQLTIGENVFLGREPRGAAGFTDLAAIAAESERLMARFALVAGRAFTAGRRVADLSPDQRQITEIVKVLARRPRLIIFDEATAALDRRQVDVFFDLLGELKAGGVASIFISHRLDEVFAITDRATVMRNGATVADFVTAETDAASLVRAMVGGEVAHVARDHRTPAAVEPRLVAASLDGRRLGPIDLTVGRGEIVGLGGLQGQGQKALLAGLFGAEPFAGGTVTLDGRPVVARRPHDAISAGIAYVSGDRSRDSALTGRSIFENAAIASLVREGVQRIAPAGLATRFREVLGRLNTRYSGLSAPISSLSGGNQQKVFIARWLTPEPSLLLLDDPTKGVDLGAKADFYGLVRALAEAGTAVVIYSSEDAELLELCDRIVVLNGGRITADLTGDRLTAFELTHAAYGEPA